MNTASIIQDHWTGRLRAGVMWLGVVPCLLSLLTGAVEGQSGGIFNNEQQPGAAPESPAPTQAEKSSVPDSLTGSRLLGSDLPFFNPSSEMFTWDGRNWNIADNRLFSARFEKFLNAPEETSDADREYQQTISEILQILAPTLQTQGVYSPEALNAAFRLLPRASNYQSDANLCDALAAAVMNVWLAKRDQRRIELAQKDLEAERRQQMLNMETIAGAANLRGQPARPNSANGASAAATDAEAEKQFKLAPFETRLVEIQALLVANRAKRELSELQTKLEFQTLMVQFFLQRRFQHVLIAARFYQRLFADGSSALQLQGEAGAFFSKSTGMPPTVAVLESMAMEAVRDVRENVDAYIFLVDNREVQSATKRLGEAFIIGEFLPEMRTLPRERKRVALLFTQKTGGLLSAVEVKDYTEAEKLVAEITTMATDFDAARPRAAIETARTLSELQLAKAKAAAMSGDRTATEAALRTATEIWPRNPALAEVSGLIFNQADVQQQALADFDRLLSQRDYRQIYTDRVRFIAASALDRERGERLREVLEKMQAIEAAIIRADEIAKTGNAPGAWESVERAHKDFPDDIRLSSVRANLTTEAAEFVKYLRRAEALERDGQDGSSLAWYLQARKAYPSSEFAREGIQRIIGRILPESDKSAESQDETP